MIYGQLQFYNDELKAWFKIIDFHKAELNELVTQLNVLLSFPLLSSQDSKAGNAFIDQLMVQDQRFDHVHHHFEHQAQRLEHAFTSSDELEHSVVELQESCRIKMKAYEVAFTKTKYGCFDFLSGFFQPHPIAVLA